MKGCIANRAGRGVTGRAILAAAALVLFAPGARAQEDEAPKYAGDLWTREALTGDWGGARTKLYEHGVQFSASYTGDASTNVSGGIRRGEGYSGLLELGMTLDLEKLVNWTGGEVYAGAYIIRGHGLSTFEVGNLLAVSSVEAPHAERLGEVYFKQTFGDRGWIRAGQILADSDFATSDSAGLFVNSAFGWPALMGVDLPAGGPAYPNPTSGVHGRLNITKELWVQAALYNGNPAGHNVNPHNLDFPINQGAFAIGEVVYEAEKGLFGLPGTYKAGAWYNSLKFQDLRLARSHDGDYALYGVIDQTVWQEASGDLKDPTPGSRAISVFGRAVVAPQENRNLIDWYFDVGFNLKAPFRARPDDIFGVGFAYAHISDVAARADRLAGSPVRSSEMVIETSYKAQATPWLAVQPFAQYVIRPGGGDPRPANPNRRIKNATVLGFRTAIEF